MAAREYLSPKDIATELGVSRSRAYEIARECRRLVFGRTVRVSREAFEAWKQRHEEQPVRHWCERPPDSSARDTDTNPFLKPILPRTKPRNGNAETSAALFRTPIVPRTKTRTEEP
jgi:hypothetical protein